MSNRRFLGEAGRFIAVGGVATVVALFLFNLLVHGFNTGEHALLPDQPILAYVIANTVGMVISYRGSRTWAFRDRPPAQADGGRTAFVAINVITMTIPVACLWFSRNVLGLDDPVSDNVAANVIGLVLGLVLRFYLFRRFIFRRPIHLTQMYDPAGPPRLPEPDHPGAGEPADLDGVQLPGGPVSEPRDPSTSAPAPPRGPSAAGG
ncbi:GtrA family protein [Nocardioides sp. SYSU DS0663]|uniref:GtrA family protein n=1 Tax=Nocardioides sp. SYSU DS0663 TaxID=3416445 RepID=UPI003F4BD461